MPEVYRTSAEVMEAGLGTEPTNERLL
jgi:hypothetical protein